jgi:hydroxymethylpyrimidine pyrophosphatase-like HAD family hydrolase
LDVPRRYDLLAIDLDGTLLNSQRTVSEGNLRALEDAKDAGMKVAICTGRGLVECDAILQEIRQQDPVVVAGGSIVGCPVRKSTLHRFALDPGLVAAATGRLLAHNHPVMVLKDPSVCGYDYMMVVGEKKLALDPVTVWWLEHMRVKHRFVDRIEEDEHPEHTVRLGVCGLSGALDEMIADMRAAFGDRATMHHFGAVVAPEHARHLNGQKLHILEVFARDASKWSGIQWVAGRHDVPLDRIAAIGDEINDLPMIRHAGLGIAMGNAVGSVKGLAKRQTLSNDEDGVAHAIYNILEGRW